MNIFIIGKLKSVIKNKKRNKDVLLLNMFVYIFFTTLSRISGFIRDITIAGIIGTSIFTDAFFIAFQIPNILRRTIADGMISSAFIPSLSYVAKTGKKKIINNFLLLSSISVCAISFVFCSLIYFNAEFVRSIVAPGFKDSEQIEFCVNIIRKTIFFTLIASIVSIFGGFLDYKNKFGYFASTPIILNLTITSVIIIGKYYLYPWIISTMFISDKILLDVIADFIIIGGILQIVFMLLIATLHGFRFCFKINPISLKACKIFVKKIFIIALGKGSYQISSIISVIFSTFSPSSSSHFYFTDRILQFGITIIGQSLGTVSLPKMSENCINKKHSDNVSLIKRCIIFALSLAIPACIASLFLSEHIIRLTYERGSFTKYDTHCVSTMLSIGSVLIPSISINRILESFFYAYGDVKNPLIGGCINLLINLINNIFFKDLFPHYTSIISVTLGSVSDTIFLTIMFIIKLRKIDSNKKDYLKSLYRIPGIALKFLILSIFISILSSFLISEFSVFLDSRLVFVFFGLIFVPIYLFLAYRVNFSFNLFRNENNMAK